MTDALPQTRAFAPALESAPGRVRSQQPVPQARGFAAALETYLARGGALESKPHGKAGYRYTEGPIKGLTVEQATQKAKQLWEKSPEAVRDKYARQDDMLLAERERLIPGLEQPSEAANVPPRRTELVTRTGRTYDPYYSVESINARSAANGRSGLASEAQPQTVNPSATAGAGRGRVITGIIKSPPAEVAPISRPSASTNSAPVDWENLGVGERPQPSSRPAALLEKPQFLDAPSRSQAISSGAVERVRINKLTGKPFGWIPPEGQVDPAAAAAKAKYAGPRTSYVPGYGMVPKAQAVPEGPISYEDYDGIRSALDSLDPASPEASAARGRMRTFEEQARARERVEMRASREASLRPAPSRLSIVRPTAADRCAAAGYGGTDI